MDAQLQNWIRLDKQHCWHPFTRQEEWCAEEHDVTMIVAGQGCWLEDAGGKKYLDGNSSIWTNIHGHNHPRLNQAIIDQLAKVAHTSYLGYAHPLASELAGQLCGYFHQLDRVFFSDDGSTAIECALKMAIQYRLQSGEPERVEFIAFKGAYHGDTLGAASMGGVNAFFERFRKLGLKVHFVESMEDVTALSKETLEKIAAVMIEPVIQGVNQMTLWPKGMLRELREWTEQRGIHLILDEVMTGFGRTGTMFACEQEGIEPDFLCLAKGLTGGYMPLAATLTTETVYEAFLGGADRAFYYGHSYTANPLGCAVALESLRVFKEEDVLGAIPEKEQCLERNLQELKTQIKEVWEIRQIGLIVGIELRHANGVRFSKDLRIGEAVCQAAKKHGLLTRPILDTIVFMPPLVISIEEIKGGVLALERAMCDVFKMNS